MRRLRLTAIALTATASVVMLTGCIGVSQDDLDKARAEGAASASQEQSAATPVPTVAQSPAPSPSTTTSSSTAQRAPAGSTECSSTISVNGSTSCSFAQNVADAYLSEGGGNRSVSAYSPITNQWYTMSCTGGVTTVCKGGNNAVVYLR